MDGNRPAGGPAAFDLPPDGILVLSHRVGPAEAAVGTRLSITALCDLLQSAAASHATALGVGGEALREQGLAWVLLQWSLEMAAWPAAGAGLLVETWPSAYSDRIVRRDFFVLSADRRRLGRATSHWAMLDLARRRPVRMSDAVRAIPVPVRDGALDAPLLRLPAPDPPEAVTAILVGNEHLDVNGHVNNVRYVEWIAASVPEGPTSRRRLAHLDVSFRAEARDGERVQIERGPDLGAAPGSVAFRHRIVTDARELALARTVFSDG
jgi:medium-chain acyl-[acyl-carrier-protein] hydrolase